jgi:hypothetical protein
VAAAAAAAAAASRACVRACTVALKDVDSRAVAEPPAAPLLLLLAELARCVEELRLVDLPVAAALLCSK